MDKTTSKFSAFFEKNFRKKFILFVSVPVLMSILFCVDYFVLQELNVIDTVSRIGKMTHTVGGEHLEMEGARLGYRYNTENNHTFSTIKKHRVPSEIKLKI